MKRKIFSVFFLVFVLIATCTPPIKVHADQLENQAVGKTIREVFADERLAQEIARILVKEMDDVLVEADLIGLHVVKLGKKQITTLQGIEHFTNIKTLTVNENHLQAFPKEVLQLPYLERLELNHNKQMQGGIPEEIKYLQQLKRFEINDTGISSLPESMTDLKNLVRLNVTGSPVQALPGDFGKLINLEELYAYNAKLTNLPKGLLSLTKLRTLVFGANHLVDVNLEEHAFIRQINSKGLQLQSNQSTEIQEVIQNESQEVRGLAIFDTFASLHEKGEHLVDLYKAVYTEGESEETMLANATKLEVSDPAKNGKLWFNQEAVNSQGDYVLIIHVKGGAFQNSIYYHKYRVIPKQGKVTVRYETENREELHPPVEMKGELATSYVAEEKSFDGYMLHKIMGTPSGQFTDAACEVTYVYKVLPTIHQVTYSDGVVDEEIFPDQSYALEAGMETPMFVGTPVREGYSFVGWSPALQQTVLQDVIYTAQWERIEQTLPAVDSSPKPSAPHVVSTPIEQPITGFETNETQTYVVLLGMTSIVIAILLGRKKTRVTD
ncbi:hypothetical protein A4S06_00740 [Erysipelotrichaceae bacterium MTC7]|nr:hypothetical protein A4S06_00740 [Erysipelotrichaceae bacterium MTC7]